MCEVIKVSKSGFYRWLKRQRSPVTKREKYLYIRILEAYEQNKGRYGSPRIYRTLRSWGVICYKNQVAKNIGYILLMVICRRLTMKGRNYLNFLSKILGELHCCYKQYF